MANSVHIKEAIVVTPSEPTPSRILSLSSLDSQLFLRFTIEYLLVYEPRQGGCSSHDRATITSRIKAALARALVPYYPLAGRVRAKQDGSGGLEVVCREQGAVFIEATSEEHTINDFDRAPKYVTQWRKLLSLQVSDVLKGAPSLVLQLTWLKDGSAALGIGFNHCICDGIGSVEFLNSFAELATGTCRYTNQIKPKPIWDRHLLNPTQQRQTHTNPSITLPQFNKAPDLCGFLSRFTNERLVPTSRTFNRTCISELKKIALASSATCTSYEVLSAHVWRSWARALNLPPNQTLKLLFSINVRNRVKPSLPSGYYGNAFVLGCAQTSVKDLTEKGLGYATWLVKRAKERVNNEYVRSVVELSESRASPDSVGVLILSQWSRLGLERVDFGLGRAVHVGPVCSDRYCLFLPAFNQTDAVRVMVAVPTTAVDKYEFFITNIYS